MGVDERRISATAVLNLLLAVTGACLLPFHSRWGGAGPFNLQVIAVVGALAVAVWRQRRGCGSLDALALFVVFSVLAGAACEVSLHGRALHTSTSPYAETRWPAGQR